MAALILAGAAFHQGGIADIAAHEKYAAHRPERGQFSRLPA